MAADPAIAIKTEPCETIINSERPNLQHGFTFVYERPPCAEVDNEENIVFIKVEEGQAFHEIPSQTTSATSQTTKSNSNIFTKYIKKEENHAAFTDTPKHRISSNSTHKQAEGVQPGIKLEPINIQESNIPVIHKPRKTKRPREKKSSLQLLEQLLELKLKKLNELKERKQGKAKKESKETKEPEKVIESMESKKPMISKKSTRKVQKKPIARKKLNNPSSKPKPVSIALPARKNPIAVSKSAPIDLPKSKEPTIFTEPPKASRQSLSEVQNSNKEHQRSIEQQMTKELKKVTKDMLLPDEFDPDFFCRVCVDRFQTSMSYRNHLHKVHQMVLSPITTKNERNLLPEKNDPNNYCRTCGITKKNRNAYLQHLMIVHNIR